MRKRHFHNQTQLYERIYFKLAALIPVLRTLDSSIMQRIDGLTQLRVEVLENHKYTTVVELSFVLSALGVVPDPRMTIRIYHDAQVAEVVEYQNRARFQPDYDYPNLEMRHPDEKHQVHRLLQEWLDYCLRRGLVLDQPTAQTI